jgi:2-keto-4-pentenoate hydratase/2-oxohepta-3-ene-1,7-dioic acid hydratase in catechol pathway
MKLASYKVRGRESFGAIVGLKPGDVVEVEVPQIGILRNTVVAEA